MEYETIIILRGDLTEMEYNAKVNSLLINLLESGGTKIKTEKIGKKKLAYEIRKNKEGWYVLFTYKATREIIETLEPKFKSNDDIIKFLSVPAEDIEDTEESESRDTESESEHASPVKSKAPIIDVFDLIYNIK